MPSHPDPLPSGIAIVTGASRGLGAAVANALAATGISVLGAARQPFGAAFQTVQADITSPDGIHHIVNAVGGRKVQILVHAAGILGPRVDIAGYPRAEWDAVMAVNLTAVFALTQALLPHMQRPGGVIINVASGAGRRAAPRWGAYAVSKFGVDGFSLLLADELKSEGIRVHSINPGGMRTAMRAAAYPDENPESVPTPETIAPFFVEVARAEMGKFPVLLEAPR